MSKRQRTAESADKGAQALMEEHGRGLLCISVAETSLGATMEVMQGPSLLAAALGDGARGADVGVGAAQGRRWRRFAWT